MARAIGSVSGEVPVHPGIKLCLLSEYCILAPRPLAGEPAKAERRYAHGIPRQARFFQHMFHCCLVFSNMLVPVAEDTSTAKVDRFGGLKLTAVEREGYSQEKKESHAWLEEKEGESSKEKQEEEKEPVVKAR